MRELNKIFADLDTTRRPPIAQWTPTDELDIDLRIDANGVWHYRQSPITRRRIVALFASLLRCETNGASLQHHLITPRVKYPVRVDDAPFCAVELQPRGCGRAQHLWFRTNVDEVCCASRAHPLAMKTDAHGNVAPYIEVRDLLQAKLSRAVYYQLTELLDEDDAGEQLGVYSDGEFFAMADKEEVVSDGE